VIADAYLAGVSTRRVEKLVQQLGDVVSSTRLGLAKIGVASDARKRLRELQVGSPVELKLEAELTRAYADRRDANGVAEELYRCFAGRPVRGSWYRVTVAEVREALARPATAEAPARARAAAEAAAHDRPLAPRRVRSRVPRRRRSASRCRQVGGLTSRDSDGAGCAPRQSGFKNSGSPTAARGHRRSSLRADETRARSIS
jgi:Meiotically up-regulated gene 113